MVAVRDASADSIFQGRAVHIPIKENCVEVQPTDQAEVESETPRKLKSNKQRARMSFREL